jgi:hypothetical protein
VGSLPSTANQRDAYSGSSNSELHAEFALLRWLKSDFYERRQKTMASQTDPVCNMKVDDQNATASTWLSAVTC